MLFLCFLRLPSESSWDVGQVHTNRGDGHGDGRPPPELADAAAALGPAMWRQSRVMCPAGFGFWLLLPHRLRDRGLQTGPRSLPSCPSVRQAAPGWPAPTAAHGILRPGPAGYLRVWAAACVTSGRSACPDRGHGVSTHPWGSVLSHKVTVTVSSCPLAGGPAGVASPGTARRTFAS